MVLHLCFYHLILFAIIWLSVILYLTWPKRSVAAPAASAVAPVDVTQPPPHVSADTRA